MKRFVPLLSLFAFFLVMPAVFALVDMNSAMSSAFSIFQNWDLAWIYENYQGIIDLILYTIFFSTLTQKILGERIGKKAALWMGIILGVSLALYSWTNEKFSLANFGPWVALLFIFVLGALLFSFFKSIFEGTGDGPAKTKATVLAAILSGIICFILLNIIASDIVDQLQQTESGSLVLGFLWILFVLAVLILFVWGAKSLFGLLGGSGASQSTTAASPSAQAGAGQGNNQSQPRIITWEIRLPRAGATAADRDTFLISQPIRFVGQVRFNGLARPELVITDISANPSREILRRNVPLNGNFIFTVPHGYRQNQATPVKYHLMLQVSRFRNFTVDPREKIIEVQIGPTPTTPAQTPAPTLPPSPVPGIALSQPQSSATNPDVAIPGNLTPGAQIVIAGNIVPANTPVQNWRLINAANPVSILASGSTNVIQYQGIVPNTPGPQTWRIESSIGPTSATRIITKEIKFTIASPATPQPPAQPAAAITQIGGFNP